MPQPTIIDSAIGTVLAQRPDPSQTRFTQAEAAEILDAAESIARAAIATAKADAARRASQLAKRAENSAEDTISRWWNADASEAEADAAFTLLATLNKPAPEPIDQALYDLAFGEPDVTGGSYSDALAAAAWGERA